MATSEPPAKRAKVISGDSLEEDFVLEHDFAPSSSDEAAGVPLGLEDLPTTIAVDLSDDDEPVAGGITLGGAGGEGGSKKKRKLGGDEEKKKEGKKAARKVKVDKAEKDRDAAPSLGLLPSESLADRMAEKQGKALPGLSAIEKDDLRLVGSMFLDTSNVTERTSLLSFIREAIPTLPSTLAKPPKKAGSPRVLVIAGAALRVADLCREVKIYKTKDIDIGKLFAKHIKLADHIEYLQKTKVGIVVGTPGRIGKLFAETESLSLTHLSHLILDVSHLDLKKRALLDMPECREDLFRHVLGDKGILERLRQGRMKLVLF